MKKTLIIATLFLTFGALADEHDHQDCPMHAAHMHAADVDHRGDAVMGFSHETTKHSFRVYDDGGAIEVRALKSDDTKSIDAIRAHLKEVAKEFASGDFAKPQAIHAMNPPGADVMASRKEKIKYEYVEIENGARVRITTNDAPALDAVHRFLKFQIEEHRAWPE